MKDTLTVRLNEEQREELEELARRSGLKLADIARVAIRRLIARAKAGEPISLIEDVTETA